MQPRRLTARHVFIFLGIWIAAFLVYRMVRSPQEVAARTSHVRHVIAAVNQHLKDHQGRWPENWAALEEVELPEDAPPRTADWPVIRRNVEVSFQVDPSELTASGPEEFEAIRPRGASGDYRADVKMLLSTIRIAEEQSQDAPDAGDSGASGSVPPERP